MIPYSSMTSPFPNEDPQSLAELSLFEAVLSDRPELINEFLDENVGFDINCTINLNQTALMFAAKFNYYNAARTLIERGAEIKHRGNSGYQAVHYACLSNSVDSLRVLIEKDESVVHETCDGGKSALHIAAHKGNIDVAKCLIDHGADINYVTPMGNSALIIALEGGQRNFASYLLSQENIDVNISNFEGATALHRAAILNDCKLIIDLICAGADAKMATNNGDLPIDFTTSIEAENIIKFFCLPSSSASTTDATHLLSSKKRSRSI